MGIKEISIVKFLKRRMRLIIYLVLIIMIFMGILSYMAINRDYENRALINILGKQRMYSQMMAKDVTRIYALREFYDNKQFIQPKEVVLYKMEAAREELLKVRNEYDIVFNSVKQGYVDYVGEKIYFHNALGELEPVIEENEKLWINYMSSINIILDEKSTDDKVVKALIYINENNDKLLENSDRITNIVVESTKKKSNTSMLFIIALGVVTVLIMTGVLANIYNYLFIPLNELYKEVSNIGIMDYKEVEPKAKTKQSIPVITEVKDMMMKLKKIISLIENLNNSNSFDEVLKYIYSTFSTFIPYNHIGIALIEESENVIMASYGISDDCIGNLGEALGAFKVKINETSLGEVINKGEARIINDLEEYTSGRPLKQYNKIILDRGIKSSITLPLSINNRIIGVIFFSSINKNVYKSKHVEFLRTIANSIALSLEKNIMLDEIVYASAMSLAKLAESRDNETGEHLNRMKIYSKTIAEVMKGDSKYKDEIDIQFIEDIQRYSPLHDIGKVAIRDEILLKPDKLTKEEFEVMKTHTLYGGRVLRAAEDKITRIGRGLFSMGIDIAEGHHEKWDGSGYPYGNKELEIPLSARIVAVADVFDALTSERPYKRAWTLDEAFKMISESSGSHFDPEVVSVFIKNKEKIISIYNSFN